MPRSHSPFSAEYNYDHPRPISPLLFSPMHCHHHSQGSKSQSRAADISRLLDPAYSSSSSRAHVSPTSVSVYVDPHGDLHDPDYRHFPAVPTTSHGAKRQYGGSPKPRWELSLENEHALDDECDELDEEDSFFLSTSTAAHPQNHSRYASSRRSSNNSGRRRPRESSFTTYATTNIYTPTYYSPTTTASTLPTSYESENTVFSHCSDLSDEKDAKKTKKRRRLSKGDKEKEKMQQKEKEALDTSFRSSFEYSRDLPPTEEEEGGAVVEADADAEREESSRGNDEYVPTCTEALQRQWQALSLRFRFGVFRAQRRMKRRVHSML
ncbi:hypothetical protein B0H34DRAFT_672677 [Crassisporium funariophilum]|nr:hypothetical protein B0H34DRAFT_282416 [Crassisporium funariophilum]KAF8163741.1 hypothetical protein B0H34DRAFT_672677 [Crassisporium funariophilum]